IQAQERKTHRELERLSQRLADQESALHEKSEHARLSQERIIELEGQLEALDAIRNQQEAQIGELQLSLNSTSETLEEKMSRLAAKQTSVQAAQAMLENLKPMLDALEDRLHDESDSMA
ncbi:MAG: hypothetical protein KDB61_04140, partial [Planctomycetes bacterium]|nr:hypothetical protein [Planctomycetota bacterium]